MRTSPIVLLLFALLACFSGTRYVTSAETPSDSDPFFDENPRHPVKIIKPFYVDVCEVTREQLEKVTRVVQSSLRLRVLDPPTTAKVGERVLFNIEVSNTGDQPVSNVIIRDQFDAGLLHTGGERSPIERAIGNMVPGDVRKFGVSFIVQRTGQLCHSIDVVAASGHAASTRVCVDTTEPLRNMNADVRGAGTKTSSRCGQRWLPRMVASRWFGTKTGRRYR